MTPMMSTPARAPVVAVLGFHKIGEPPADGWETWFRIPEMTFVAHLRHIRDDGWHVLDLATFLGGLEAPTRLPDRSVLLTFDDGDRSVHDVALPWLQRFGYPAVVFVPTAFIGGKNSFDADSEPTETMCEWDDLHALERSGVRVQSHGVSHRALSALDPDEQEHEVVRSKAVLEAGLGTSVDVFAYPYGDGGSDPQRVRGALERAGYRAAFLFGGGPTVLPAADPYRVERVAVGPDTDLAQALGRGRCHA